MRARGAIIGGVSGEAQAQVLASGAEVLGRVLVPEGFMFVAGEHAAGSGGSFATGRFCASFQETGDSHAFGISWAKTMRAIAAPTIVGVSGAREVRLGPCRSRHVEGPVRPRPR